MAVFNQNRIAKKKTVVQNSMWHRNTRIHIRTLWSVVGWVRFCVGILSSTEVNGEKKKKQNADADEWLKQPDNVCDVRGDMRQTFSLYFRVDIDDVVKRSIDNNWMWFLVFFSSPFSTVGCHAFTLTAPSPDFYLWRYRREERKKTVFPWWCFLVGKFLCKKIDASENVLTCLTASEIEIHQKHFVIRRTNTNQSDTMFTQFQYGMSSANGVDMWTK